MKAAGNQIENIAAGAFWRLYAVAGDSMRGCRYWRAAEIDEKSGFPFTAAMEWQHAAECFSWTGLLADRCWRQWERIVHLPRHLSKPIGEPETVVLQSIAATSPAREIEAAEGLVAQAA